MQKVMWLSRADIEIGGCQVFTIEHPISDEELLKGMYTVTSKTRYMQGWWEYELTKMPI